MKKEKQTNHKHTFNGLFVSAILLINFALFAIKENLISTIAKSKCDNQLIR